MSTVEATGFQLRFLGFFGPQKPPATISFGPGLNVIYGASDTGKSFIVEAIDFMLGGSQLLHDIPERVGYDRILLGIESLNGASYTIQRSIDGGDFRLYTSSYLEPPGENVDSKALDDKHSDRDDANLSTFLLGLCDLTKKKVRKNAHGETNNLSFRNIARLIIVTETEIVQQYTPLYDGNQVRNTSNVSTFKLLLTGTDDSALVPKAKPGSEELSRNARLSLLEELLENHRERLSKLTANPRELIDQLAKIDTSLNQYRAQVTTTETEFQHAAREQRNLRRELEEGRERRGEVASLVERFNLLDRHYVSDIDRLRAIEEGGTLFNVLGSGDCPLCGAATEHHRSNEKCSGDIGAVVEAARKEIDKIEVLRRELEDTVRHLTREREKLDRRLFATVKELQEVAQLVEELIAPKLSALRKSYSEFADKRAVLREALNLYATVQDLEERRDTLAGNQSTHQVRVTRNAGLPTAVTHEFAKTVESILTDWHFPQTEEVYFDNVTNDLVIAGKARAAFGKGLRAITHAAFTLGILAFCRMKKTPHAGFVVLDSPLLAYREPDETEEDLRGTDLQTQFYSYLKSLSQESQVIIVENIDPPADIMELDQSIRFTKNPHQGRYGLFPLDTVSSG